MKRFGGIVLLFCLAAVPAQAESPRVAQVYPDSTFYRTLSGFFNEAELTARLELGAYRWVQDVPLIGGATFRDKRIDGRLRPVTLYLGGIEAGIRFRQVRLLGWYRLNLGDGNIDLLPSGKTGLRFRNGEIVGELAGVRFSDYGVRLEYAPSLFKTFLFGGGVSYHAGVVGVGPIFFDDDGDKYLADIYIAESSTELLFLYIPMRYRFAWGTLHARAGLSIWGAHNTEYKPVIAYHNPAPGEPPAPPGSVQKLVWTFKDADPHGWFAEAGVAMPVYGSILHVGLHVERIRLEGAYTETVGGLKLQVGLPF